MTLGENFLMQEARGRNCLILPNNERYRDDITPVQLNEVATVGLSLELMHQ
jgi:hypothetical protein